MRTCFLHGYGNCRGKVTGEHYISESVLGAISAGRTVQVGGLPWQPPQTLQVIGIQSLVANILCEGHNSGLSELDNAAGALFRTLNDVDKNPIALPNVVSHDGALVERWFLKVLCGLTAGVGWNNGVIPPQWAHALIEGNWPEGWGLYASAPSGFNVFAKELSITARINPATNEILAVDFRVAGVHFSLLVGRPDTPLAWGIYRPFSLIFRSECERRVEFAWPGECGGNIEYTKVSKSRATPPQWHGWSE